MTRKASPQHARQAAVAIVRRLRDAGHTAYFAGGCVRDELLGLSPTDYDVATDATPERIAALFRRTAEVGAAFGVVLVTLDPSDGVPAQATVEVATFRSDGPYSDRRRPDRITFSTPEADAQRRDFTINALFLDPLAPPAPPEPPASGAGGRVIDFVGGLTDLNARIIRAVGNPEARLAEDHLRALRAVRFTARLNFKLDDQTAAAIRAHARYLEGVSRERIGDEMRRMAADPNRAHALALLEELDLDAPVLMEASTASTLTSVLSLSDDPPPAFHCTLAAWALDRGLTITGPQAGAGSLIARTVSRYRSALCLSNEERSAMADALHTLAALESEWDRAGVARRRRLAGSTGTGFADALRLLAGRDPARAGQIRSNVAALASTPPGLAPPPLLTGDDLVALGLKPGPWFKTLLDALYDAQLEGRITTREQAVALLRELEGRSGV